MPRYIYTAKSHPQKIIRGDIEAESEQDAINKLTKIGCFPISIRIEDISLYRQDIWHFRKAHNKDIVLISRQLTGLIESGVNILNSLTIISRQASNKYLRAVLFDIISKIKDGKSFSESLSAHPQLFSNLYISMIRSGEAGGSLELTLKRLADFLEKEEEFKNSLRSALTYPAFVFIVGVMTVIVLLGFVIPRLVAMFKDMGQILPLPTRILINVSAFLRGYWWLVIAIIFIAVFLLKRTAKKPQGRIQLDRLKLKLPVWGEIVLKTEIARLMRTLSLLLSSGIPIVYALDISASTVGNQILRLEAGKFKGQISGGASFSKCLRDSAFFPTFVTNIVTVGEESGSLEKSLWRIADDYEIEVDRTLKVLTRLLEPAIILAMGLIVGFIVLSMLLPIFQINLIVR
jgi:type II secretory pathway component PulF